MLFVLGGSYLEFLNPCVYVNFAQQEGTSLHPILLPKEDKNAAFCEACVQGSEVQNNRRPRNGGKT